MSSSVDLCDARIMICEREKILFGSKSHRRDWANEVRVYELVRLLRSLLRHTVVVFYCLCLFTAITYVLIVNIVNVVVGSMFS